MTIEQLAEEQGIKPGDWKIAAERARGVCPRMRALMIFSPSCANRGKTAGRPGIWETLMMIPSQALESLTEGMTPGRKAGPSGTHPKVVNSVVRYRSTRCIDQSL